MPDPLRVLLIAEAANPRWVSVPLVGWSHARAIARLPGVQSHLVTQVRNRDAIAAEGLVEGVDFTAIDSESVAAPLTKFAEKIRGGKGRGWTTKMAVNALATPYFWKLVWQRFGEEIRRGRWDVVHQLTPLSPTISSPLAMKCKEAGVPYVWGPLNGGVPWPRQFDAARRQEREWLSYFRDVFRLLPGYRSTRAGAAAIVVGSRDTLEQMPRDVRRKCVYLPENAIEPDRFTARRTRTATTPLKLVFLGRLVPYKGCDMLLEAIAPLVHQGKLTLDILGTGPQEASLRAMTQQLAIERGVKFVGWVQHDQVQHHLAQADVFAFPSVREFGGGVAVEAMAVGLPPMVVAYGGLAELVTDRTGWLVPIGSRQQVIDGFLTKLATLCDNPSPIEAKSRAALCRAHEQFTWDAKARHTRQIYDWVTGHSSKPDFGLPIPDVA